MAALVVTTPFNDMISLTAGWARPVDLYSKDKEADDNATTTDNMEDEVDVIFLALPIKTDGIAITPFYATAIIGQSTNRNDQSCLYQH